MLLAMTFCTVNSCENELYSKDVCRRHYDMLRRTGGEIVDFQQERHGLRNHPIYKSWLYMRNRVSGYKETDQLAYKDRNITICEEWLNSFQAFYDWAIENGWREGLELDRIDNDKGYGPENCQWSTRSQNMRNTRRKVEVTAFGETKTVADWADDSRCVVTYKVLLPRIKRGWDAEEAITTRSERHPKGPRKNREDQ